MRGKELLKDWKFYLGEPEGPHLLSTDDGDWRTVTLPHDWSVEFEFDKERGEACTGYLLGGVGWYRKHFITEKSMENKRVVFNFDGIYNRSTIYCNGHVLKFHPYGYSPVLVDVTEYLNSVGEDNVIAVHVDHSRYADSRWYTGSGIYRKVSMHVLPEIHIPVWGVKIQTDSLEPERAKLSGYIMVNNDSNESKEVDLKIKIVSPENEIVVQYVENIHLKLMENKKTPINIAIDNPILWQVYEGDLYQLNIELIYKNRVIQSKGEHFGIRTIRFDADKGFFLNDKPTLIKGVCLHHDAGLVGAAVPGDVWRRRLEKLKECGCNAIRTAHNPFSEDFMDICDEMGFLVQEEFFDDWDHPKDKRTNTHEKVVDYITRSYTEFFRDYSKSDLQDTVKRDMNHPCIIQWSIGNEIEWTYPKYKSACGFFSEDALGYAFWRKPPYSRKEIVERINKIPKDVYDIGSTAKKLSNWTKDIDGTRPVIANCILPSLSYENGYIDALDMVGFSYRRVMYGYGHKYFPNIPITGTENKAQWHEWEAVLENEYISGVFLWMGIEHMGEAWVQKSWPRKASNLGLLDLACFEKPAYHMFKTLWSGKPYIKLFTQKSDKSLFYVNDNGTFEYRSEGGYKRRTWYWQDVNDYWNYSSGDDIVVEVYSNCESVELYLNDKSLGIKYLKDFDDRIYKWIVPYAPGSLVAKGFDKGQEYKDTLITTGDIYAIKLSTDKEKLNTNIDSAAHIVACLVDNQGNLIHDKEAEIEFMCCDNTKILGVDNGHPDNVQKYQHNTVKTSEGRCLLIVQAKNQGQISIYAKIKNMHIKSQEININVAE